VPQPSERGERVSDPTPEESWDGELHAKLTELSDLLDDMRSLIDRDLADFIEKVDERRIRAAVEAERERSSELREALGWYENATVTELEADTGIRAHNALGGDERGDTAAAIRGGDEGE